MGKGKGTLAEYLRLRSNDFLLRQIIADAFSLYRKNRTAIRKLRKKLNISNKRNESFFSVGYAHISVALNEFEGHPFTSEEAYELVKVYVTRTEMTNILWHMVRKGRLIKVRVGSGKRLAIYQRKL